MTKNQRSGFVFWAIAIVIIEIGIYLYPLYFISKKEPTDIVPNQVLIAEKNATAKIDNPPITHTPFNPNALTVKEFEALGFSEKQAAVIVKYRQSLGGNFGSVYDFKSCFVVSDQKFEELKPYIKLQKISHSFTPKNYTKTHTRKISLKKFNPNKLNQRGWEQLGFSPKQAQVILKYKNNYCGGYFENKKQIANCFVISAKKFAELNPYISLLPKKKPSQAKPLSNPNTFTITDWEEIGLSTQDSKNIIKYRDFIGGFKDITDLEKCQFIDSLHLEKLRKIVTFTP